MNRQTDTQGRRKEEGGEEEGLANKKQALMWLLFVLHKVVPPLFVLFLNSLPVIACTSLLLGVLLIHSEPNTRKHRHAGDRTRKDSVTESLGFRATRRTVVRRVISDADSDEWHEIDREQDGDPNSDFKSERSGSSMATAASMDGSDVGEKDGEEKAVSWSEDDQRILIQIGNSELERNRRLERVIAIRNARLMMDGNGGDEPPSMLSPTQSPLDLLPRDPAISKENSSCSTPDEADEEGETDSSNSQKEANKKPDAAGADQFSCWFAQSLASVEEHESLSKEVSVIEEGDVIGLEMYRARKGFGFDGPVVRAVPTPAPASAAKKALLRSSVVSMRM